MRILSPAFGAALLLAAGLHPAEAKRGPGAGTAEGLFHVGPIAADEGEPARALCILTGTANIGGLIPLYTWSKKYVLSDEACTGDRFYNVEPGLIAMMGLAGLLPEGTPAEPALPLLARAEKSWGGIAGIALLLLVLAKARNAVGGAARSFKGGDKLPEHARRTVEVMCRMALIDGNVDASEAAAIARTVQGLTGHPVAGAEILAALRSCGTPLKPAQIAALGRGLDARQRDMVMRGALHVALADGGTDPAEEAFLFHLAKALKIRPAQVDTMMDEVARSMGIGATAPAERRDLSPSAGAVPA